MTTGQMLRIEGEFTIYRAMELKPVLFAQPPVTEIDLSGVTEFDSSGLQLLMLAKKRQWLRGGLSFCWGAVRSLLRCLSYWA